MLVTELKASVGDLLSRHPYATPVTLLLILVVLFIFRHHLFYSRYYYQHRNDQNWSQVLSFGDYIDSLLTQPDAKKLKISYDLVNDIYLTNIDNEKISIKKMKTSKFFFRVFLQIISRGPVWFLRHSLTERSNFAISPTPEAKVALENDAVIFDQNHIHLLLNKKQAEADINGLLLDAILKNIPTCQKSASSLSNNERRHIFKDILITIVHFVRGAGYLYPRQLISKETLFDDKDFFNAVVKIGANLDPGIFRVRIRLAQTVPNVTLPVPKPDLIVFEYRSIEQTAKNQIDTAREKFRNVRDVVKEHMKEMNSTPEEDFFARPEAIASNLTEPEEIGIKSPEVLASDNKIAQIFTRSLVDLGVIPIKDASVSPLVETANKFTKAYRRKNKHELYQPLLNQVTASKLGIEPKWFDFNPGFKEFAIKTHLHRYLYVYGHELSVNRDTGEISIMFEGAMLTWKKIQPKLRLDETDSFAGQYSRTGLVNYGLYDWDEFVPFYIEESLPPPWGDRYLCEICSWIIDKPRVRGDHSFIRLKTPQGEWFSAGQYVPSKLGNDRYMFPMSLKPSRFMAPDVSEFYEGHFTTLPFEITREQFLRMKEKIENDKKQGAHLYQIYENNCTIWAKSIVELADLDLPSSLSAADLIAPGFTTWGRKINKMRYTPRWLKSIVKLIWAIFLNGVGLILGSGMIHKQVKSDPNLKTAVPYIRNWNDLTDVKKVISHHPFVIGAFVRQQVEDWREARIKILQAKLESLSDYLETLSSDSTEVLIQKSEACDERIDSSASHPETSPLASDSDDSIDKAGLTEQEINDKIASLQREIESTRYAIPDRFKKQRSSSSPSQESDNTIQP